MRSQPKTAWLFVALAFAMVVLSRMDSRAQNVIAWGSDLDNECNVPAGIVNPIAIAAGAFHTLVLQSNGTVIAWGENGSGQTNVPASATNVIAIAAGSEHSLALSSNGSVVAWGGNTYGQTNVPPAASNVVALAAGWAHSVALRADGAVIAWGNNDYGQTNVPPFLTGVIAIAAGYYHNLALRSDGTVVTWGSQYMVPPSATNVVALAAGWEHSLALRADGSVVAWGNNYYGQATVPAFITNAIAIAAGFGHSLVELPDGSAFAWGRNYFGVTNVPAGLNNVAGISCGEDHEVAMATAGMPWVNIQGQPAPTHVNGETLFTASAGGAYPLACQWYQNANPVYGATNRWLQLTGVQLTNAGAYSLVASNAMGQATSGAVNLTVESAPYFLTPWPTQQNALPGTALCLSVPVAGADPLSLQAQLNGNILWDETVTNGSALASICFGPATYGDSGILDLAVTNDSDVYTGLVANVAITPVIAWGDNSAGQLFVPTGATNVASFACGGDHSLALRNDGTIVAWGDNTFNQNAVPASAADAVAVAEGESHSLALRNDGSVVAWGDNTYGQTNVPATVSNAVAVAAGSVFSQALLPNGQIIEWGSTWFGGVPAAAVNVMLMATRQVNSLVLRANGALVQWGSNLAAIPKSATNVVAIAAGDFDSLVLRGDGSVVAWGDNAYGQTNVPAAVTNVVAIAAGDDHFIALRGDGSVIAWGDTNYYQSYVPASATSCALIGAGSVHSLALAGQPFNQTASAGGSVIFTAPPLLPRLVSYQWQFDGANIAGATNATLALADVNANNAGVYRLVVRNALGALTNAPMSLTVTANSLAFDLSNFNVVATNGAVQMRLLGSSGVGPVTFYASSNLMNWVPIFTNPPTIDPIDFTDLPPAGWPQRFYRAMEQP